MKEIYESPELNLISYVPAENIAYVEFDFGQLSIGNGGENRNQLSGDIGIDF